MSIVLDEMKLASMVYDVEFHHFIESRKVVAGDLLEGKIDFVLSDRQYSVRNDRRTDNALHDIIKTEDMSDYVNLARQVMAAGAQRHVF